MLPQSQRLPSFAIAPLMRRGRRVRMGSIECAYALTTMQSRFAFVVSVKADKRATARNRMKRMLREAVQHLFPTVRTGVDAVFVVRGTLPESTHEVEPLIREVFMKIGAVPS